MNIVDLVPVHIEGRGTVTNNWYALRDAGGLLLMVGPYLPAPAEGVSAERVEETNVPPLLAEIRDRLGEPPREIVFRGQIRR